MGLVKRVCGRDGVGGEVVTEVDCGVSYCETATGGIMRTHRLIKVLTVAGFVLLISLFISHRGGYLLALSQNTKPTKNISADSAMKRNLNPPVISPKNSPFAGEEVFAPTRIIDPEYFMSSSKSLTIVRPKKTVKDTVKDTVKKTVKDTTKYTPHPKKK